MNSAHPILPFQDNPSVALGYLLQKGEAYTDFTEAIYRQEVNLLRSMPQGVLLQRKKRQEYLLAADNLSAGILLLAKLPEGAKKITAHGESALQAIAQRYPQATATEKQLWCYLATDWPGAAPAFEVWPLDQGDVAETMAFDPTIPLQELRDQIDRRQVFGACIDDQLAGTIGIAPGGEIAWLTVDPGRRGQGIATGLLRWILRRELENCHVPYLIQNPDHPCPLPLLISSGFQQVGTLWEIALD